MSARVLIVDDHVVFRAFARRLLNADGFDVVGEAADGTDAVAAVLSLRPDVVLLDVQLPDLDGFRVAEQLAERDPAPAVVLVSSRDRGDYWPRVETSPAVGFLAKAELSGPALARLLGWSACGG